MSILMSFFVLSVVVGFFCCGVCGVECVRWLEVFVGDLEIFYIEFRFCDRV